MILDVNTNLPVSAPSAGDVTALLTAYRTWSDNPTATPEALYLFITRPSAERTHFLELLKHTPRLQPHFVDNKYTVTPNP